MASNGGQAEPRGGRVLRTASAGVLEELLFDLRFALRSLRRNPTFAAVAVGTVAIGMAATTAVLSIGQAVLIRPPPILEPDRVVSIWELRDGGVSSGPEGLLLPYPRYQSYRGATRDVFRDLAAHSYGSFGVATEQGTFSVNGFFTSGNYFPVLGIAPELGRFYDSDDEESVVLSDRLWRSRFAADPAVVGRTLTIVGRTFTVTGVASPGFTGTMSMISGDLWVPARAYARVRGIDERAMLVVPIGRLLPGLDRTAAEERVAAVAASTPLEDLSTIVRGARFDRLQWRADAESVLRIGLGVLLATAVLVLLIACGNIAAMTVARAHDRRREVAVRLAIGAGRGRLVRQMLSESLLLAIVGGVCGVVLAYLGTALLSATRFPVGVTLTLDATPDRRVLLASFLVAAATGLLFGLRPALRAAGANLATSLKEGADTPTSARRRNLFVTGQLSLATLLLVTAGLFIRSFVAVTSAPLGFDPEGVEVASVSTASRDYSEGEGRRFFTQLLERVRAIPGVQAAGLARWVLLGGGSSSRDGHAVDAGEDAPPVDIVYNTVDPGFFETNRVELVEGRFFTDEDSEGAPRTAVINQTLAERLWPGQSALGHVFRTGDADHEVVGVVRDGVYVSAAEMPRPYSYHPFAQNYRSSMALHVRSAGDPSSVASEVRDVVRDLDPNVSVGEWRTMEDVVSVSTFLQRFTALLSTLFGAIGVLLGAIGAYGLLAVQVARRGREFGVRMALGAKARDVLLLVLGRGARVAVVGCLAGIALSALAGRWVASLLYYDVSPYDIVTLALAPAVLMGAVLVASSVPARRATRASTAAILREE